MTVGRYLEQPVRTDLGSRIVLVAGPGGVGKTTMAKRVLSAEGGGVYFSWDRRDDRRALREPRWPDHPTLVALDELARRREWENWLAGEFEAHRERLRFLITGSSRLDAHGRGDDPFGGWYRHYRPHPLSVAEVEWGRRRSAGAPPAPGAPLDIPERTPAGALEALARLGGFPEPFLGQSERAARRRRMERLDRLFREDVRDFEAVRDPWKVETLADLLMDRVGKPLSLNALREDLDASHNAVSHWLDVLERLHHVFRIRPYQPRGVRDAMKKRAKAYLWDWAVVSEEAVRFENLAASHLLKFCHFLEDGHGRNVELSYLRDAYHREVSFLVSEDRKPWFLVEVHLAEQRVAYPLRYYRDRLLVPHAYQVVAHGRHDFLQDGVRCLPAAKFLAALV